MSLVPIHVVSCESAHSLASRDLVPTFKVIPVFRTELTVQYMYTLWTVYVGISIGYVVQKKTAIVRDDTT